MASSSSDGRPSQAAPVPGRRVRIPAQRAAATSTAAAGAAGTSYRREKFLGSRIEVSVRNSRNIFVIKSRNLSNCQKWSFRVKNWMSHVLYQAVHVVAQITVFLCNTPRFDIRICAFLDNKSVSKTAFLFISFLFDVFVVWWVIQRRLAAQGLTFSWNEAKRLFVGGRFLKTSA